MEKSTKESTDAAKRPSNNPDMPQQAIDKLSDEFHGIKNTLSNYAAHLRALDRKRLNEVGIKRIGFIERAYQHAKISPEFLPSYLSIEKFSNDNAYSNSFNILYDLSKEIQEILWNIVVQTSDISYTDALEFYASVHEAAKRRIDPAESIYKDLQPFFKHKKTEGKKPKQIGGKNKVLDVEIDE